MQGRMNGLQNMMAAKVGRQETLDRRWVFLLVALSMGPKRINLYSTSCRIMCGMVTLFLLQNPPPASTRKTNKQL